ncbi:MAG TPA: lmo0937 family membrane protein [Flavobacteriaceae bacterium]|nr:lmo0937 family membrane protein [Flavobacteriaceae bacterium]
MGRILYIIVVVLILIWAIGFLGGLITNGLIHTLLVVAAIIFLYRIISGSKKS